MTTLIPMGLLSSLRIDKPEYQISMQLTVLINFAQFVTIGILSLVTYSDSL